MDRHWWLKRVPTLNEPRCAIGGLWSDDPTPARYAFRAVFPPRNWASEAQHPIIVRKFEIVLSSAPFLCWGDSEPGGLEVPED